MSRGINGLPSQSCGVGPSDHTAGRDAEPSAAITAFGVGIDKLAREVAGWPDSHVVFEVEVINPTTAFSLPPERVQVRLVGGRPKGIGKHGMPTWARTARERQDLEAVVTMADYRAALTDASAQRSTADAASGSPGRNT